MNRNLLKLKSIHPFITSSGDIPVFGDMLNEHGIGPEFATIIDDYIWQLLTGLDEWFED